MTQIVSVFGATGSIGRSTADLLAQHADRFRVGALVGGKDPVALAQMARALNASYAALAEASAGPALAEALSGSGIPNGAGEGAVMEAVARDADIVVAAVSGAAGLKSTHAALRLGRKVALANKESLVCAGRRLHARRRALRRHHPADGFRARRAEPGAGGAADG